METELSLLAIMETAVRNPFLLTFISIWVIGWFIKHKTPINNNYIPLICIIVGVLIPIPILGLSFTNCLIGVVISIFQIGGYELVKNTTRIFLPIKSVNNDDIQNTEDSVNRYPP